MARSRTANRRLASRRNGSFRGGFRSGKKVLGKRTKDTDSPYDGQTGPPGFHPEGKGTSEDIWSSQTKVYTPESLDPKMMTPFETGPYEKTRRVPPSAKSLNKPQDSIYKVPGLDDNGGGFGGELNPQEPIVPENKEPFGEGGLDPQYTAESRYSQRQVSACLRQQLQAGVPLNKAEDKCKGR